MSSRTTLRFALQYMGRYSPELNGSLRFLTCCRLAWLPKIWTSNEVVQVSKSTYLFWSGYAMTFLTIIGQATTLAMRHTVTGR